MLLKWIYYAFTIRIAIFVFKYSDKTTFQELYSTQNAIVVAIVRSYLTFQFFSGQSYKKAL